MYLGSSRGMERTLLPPTGIRTHFVPMAPPTSARGITLLLLATMRAVVVLIRTRPRVTVATGGYASTPAAAASWLLRIPVVLFLPDIMPGKAVAWLAPLSRRIAVTTEASLEYFPEGKAVVTGYPLREAFAHPSRTAGRSRFHIPDAALALCVFGGSQGSRHINSAIGMRLPYLLERYHVIHICGAERIGEAEVFARRLAPELSQRYSLFPYLQDDDMAAALAAADLAVCRAGASVLGELPATQTPAILIPLPQQAVHQRENAHYLAERGAAVVVEDERVETDLVAAIDRVLSDPEALAGMARASAALARPNAADAIVDLMESVGM